MTPDFLTNYELGWKTTFGPVRWNGAIFHERWKKFQFAFLGANSFTEIHNARDANINGLETDLSYVRGGLTLNAAAAYTDAKTKGNICNKAGDPTPDCSTLFINDPTDPDDDDQDFIVAPSGTRLPLTPKFKATGTARYSWPVWANAKAHVQGSVTYRGSAPSSLRTEIELVRQWRACEPERLPGKASRRDFGRSVRRPRLAALEHRDVRHQRLRPTDRPQPDDRLRQLHACARCAGTASDDRDSDGHEILNAAAQRRVR